MKTEVLMETQLTHLLEITNRLERGSEAIGPLGKGGSLEALWFIAQDLDPEGSSVPQQKAPSRHSQCFDSQVINRGIDFRETSPGP